MLARVVLYGLRSGWVEVDLLCDWNRGKESRSRLKRIEIGVVRMEEELKWNEVAKHVNIGGAR